MAKTQDTDNTKCWQGCEATGTFIHCWWECRTILSIGMQDACKNAKLWNSLAVSYKTKPYSSHMVDPLCSLIFTQMNWKHVQTKKKKLHMESPYDPAIPKFLYFRYISQNIKKKTWKQLRCPPVGKWINKLWYSKQRNVFSAKKKWGIKPWKDVEER